MSLKYMLDTNIASFIIRNHSKKLNNRVKYTPVTDMCISVVTRAELRYGVIKKANNEKLANKVDEFLANITILEWENTASERYAFVRNDLETKGNTIGNMDMLIASHALAENLIIITNNTREFERVVGLPVEDWTK